MITEVTFKNFRAFRSAKFTLGPLTALVGPNASGKTSILTALNPQFGATAADAWRRESDGPEMFLHHDGRAMPSYGWQRSYSHQLLRFNLDHLRIQNQVAEVRQLAADGSNLTNAFETLTRAQRIALAKELCDLVPVFRDVDTKPTAGGNKQLIFEDRWQPGLWFTPEQVSDGTMLMLAFLLLRYQQPAPNLITIEEPERGLHPYLMGKLVDLLRALSNPTSDGSNKHSPIQIVLATQSAELLNFLKPEELRFLNKNAEDGSVTVEQISTDDPGWRKAYDAHLQSLGDVWLSGGVGGVPPL